MSYIHHDPSDVTPVHGTWCVGGDTDVRPCLLFLHSIYTVKPRKVPTPLLSGALVSVDGGPYAPAQLPSVFETHLVEGMQVWTFNVYSAFLDPAPSRPRELCIQPWAYDPSTGDKGDLSPACQDVSNVTVVPPNPIESIQSQLLFGNWTKICSSGSCRLMGHVAVQAAVPGVITPVHGEMRVSLDNGTTWGEWATAIVSNLCEFDEVDGVWHQRFHVAFDRFIDDDGAGSRVCMKTSFVDELTLKSATSDFSAVVAAKSGGYLGDSTDVGCWEVPRGAIEVTLV